MRSNVHQLTNLLSYVGDLVIRSKAEKESPRCFELKLSSELAR